ncbi:MAG: hypothetical protein ACR2K1_09920 [Saprospiraceae bacterium]
MTQTALKWWLEYIWWIVTAVVIYAILVPVYKAMHVWPFLVWNIVFIATLMTMTRHIFLLPYTFLARKQVLKVAIILALFPITFALVNGLNIFLTYVEENTWETLTGHLPAEQKRAIESYLWTEMIFFGIGSVIAAPALAVRLFISIWKQHNEKPT